MLQFCVVFEDRADFQIATELADRILIEHVDWLQDPDVLDSVRVWTSAFEGSQFRWRDIDGLGKRVGITIRGYFDRIPAKPDSRRARQAIQVMKRLIPHVSGIVLIRDADKEIERKQGLEMARQEHIASGSTVAVVVGLAVTKRECWVLAGYEPTNDLERNLLENENEYLGFNPVTMSHQLTAQHDENNDKRSAKRVVSKLTQNDFERESTCWRETRLATLRANGSSNGLRDYLGEVELKLVPIIRRPDARGGRA